MAATGTAVLDFTTTPSEQASVVVTGQANIQTTSLVEGFFMDTTTADNGSDEHQEAAALCPLVCGTIVAGTGFTITAHPIAALGVGTFTVAWAWS